MLLLSIGENCLPGMVLKRYGVKQTWSTPYTNGKSNIKYALMLEEENYVDLLNQYFIVKDNRSGHPNFFRNIKYRTVVGDGFIPDVSNGVEFTHHDVVNNVEAINSFRRKISRMHQLKSSDDDVTFFYYHRYQKDDKIEAVLEDCAQFAKLYQNEKRSSKVIIWQQILIENIHERRLVIKSMGDCILCTFYTERDWNERGGGDISVELDDDLVRDMFIRLHEMKLIDDISFLDTYRLSFYYLMKNDVAYRKLIESKLKASVGKKNYIWGAGDFGYAAYEVLKDINLSISGVIDSKQELQGKSVFGLSVLPFDRVEEASRIIVCIKDNEAVTSIRKRIYDAEKNIEVLSWNDVRAW